MTRSIAHDVTKLENVIFVCFGNDGEWDLPQVASEDDIIIDLMSHTTGKSRSLTDAEIHHQIDPDTYL